jgi:hypothetical protein
MSGQRGRHVEGLQCDWTYAPEPLAFTCYARYLRRVVGARSAPPFAVIRDVSNHPTWMIYFIYIPNGILEPYHQFTLQRLRAHGWPLFIVVASPGPAQVPEPLHDYADALYWKALNGYDFSAYSLALRAIARQSPGARVMVLNDSVFGPYGDLNPFMDAAPWDLTGFTATDVSLQRHIQSYAFIMKDVTDERLDRLRRVLPTRVAFSSAFGAIACQELWFARIASRSMSVGAYWWGADKDVHDPSLTKAIALVEAGFPFVKRSLLTRQTHFHPPGTIAQLVQTLNEKWADPGHRA